MMTSCPASVSRLDRNPPRREYATVNTVTASAAAQYSTLPSAPKYCDVTLVFDHTSLKRRMAMTIRNRRAASMPYLFDKNAESDAWPPRVRMK